MTFSPAGAADYHLGDHFEALPTSHGFQEFWGYLYHLTRCRA